MRALPLAGRLLAHLISGPVASHRRDLDDTAIQDLLLSTVQVGGGGNAGGAGGLLINFEPWSHPENSDALREWLSMLQVR